jgi:hypothetical protein
VGAHGITDEPLSQSTGKTSRGAQPVRSSAAASGSVVAQSRRKSNGSMQARGFHARTTLRCVRPRVYGARPGHKRHLDGDDVSNHVETQSVVLIRSLPLDELRACCRRMITSW